MQHEQGFRVYGLFVGNGSMQRVSIGVAEGLHAIGQLRGTVGLDGVETDPPPGALAEYGFLEGPLSMVAKMHAGAHRKRYAMLAPNSTWLPAAAIESAAKLATLVAPSDWGRKILSRYCPEESLASSFPHGISQGFRPDEASFAVADQKYDGGQFSVLHMASTDMQRKGTAQLIAAWCEMVAHGELGLDPRLDIVLEGNPEGYRRIVEKGPERARNTVSVLPRWNAPDQTLAALYGQYHVVCQPSRAEGFGLVPLEAAASGVAVVMTECTGHGQYIETLPAAVRVSHGQDEPIDDGPSALAPSVQASWVGEALLEAYRSWTDLAQAARENARDVRRQWSWQKVTELWLEKEQIT